MLGPFHSLGLGNGLLKTEGEVSICERRTVRA
jgi:hypothetical protein